MLFIIYMIIYNIYACYIIYNNTYKHMLILLFILIEISGVDNVPDTHTLIHTNFCVFLRMDVGTKENDKKHKIWGVLSSIKEAQHQSVLGVNRQITFQCCHPLCNLYNCTTNCAISSLSSVNFVTSPAGRHDDIRSQAEYFLSAARFNVHTKHMALF